MTSRDQAATRLAQLHYEIESGLTHVIRILGPDDAETNPGEPIKLLEVNENTVPSGIMPIQFGPSRAVGLDFSSIIVEVTPEEYDQILTHQLSLPPGWQLGEFIPRHAETAVP